MKKIRFGVIGCGSIANEYHLPALRRVEGAQLVWACDLIEERAQKAKDDFGFEKYTLDYHDILNDSSIDAVCIFTKIEMHATLCIEAAAAGKPARAYKLRVEMGWGNSEELTRWAGRITTDGRLAGANLYLRGRSLLSPTNHDGSPVEVNEIDNRVLEQDTQAFAWQCETVRNKSTLHPQTDAVVAEIEGGPDTVVNVTVNGRTHTASIAQFLDGDVTWHVKPWHSEAVKIHAAVPDSAYEMVLEAEDEGSGGMDVYHAEFAQKNGQWAFVSPIYAGL